MIEELSTKEMLMLMEKHYLHYKQAGGEMDFVSYIQRIAEQLKEQMTWTY